MGKAKKKKLEVPMKVRIPNTKDQPNRSHIYNGKPDNETKSADIVSSLWKPVTISAIVFGVYFQTLHPSLPGGDSGELIVAASEFGVAHPPGYPLFTVLTQCMLEFFPFGTPAWRVNLLTAITSSLAAGLLFIVVERLTDRSSAALLSVGIFSFSRLTWTWSVTAEVFGLNNFFIALLILLAVVFEQAQENKKHCQLLALFGSFTCGLSLCNQHTSVLYILCIVPWALTILYSTKALSIGLVLKLCATLGLGLLPYIYLPLSAYTHTARWTWGDQRSITGFLTHLLRMEYGTFDLLKDHSGQGLLHGVRSYLEHIYTDLTPVGFLLAIFSVIGAVKRFSQHHKSTCVCIFYLMLVTYVVFFGWRANLDVQNPLLLGVVERFWIQSDMVVVVLAAVTYIDFIDMVGWLIDIPKWRLDFVLSAVLLLFQLELPSV